MELSKQQSAAAKAIETWHKSNQQEFFLSGYAGTGKTTLVKELLAYFPEFVMVAPTGKAASVLAAKTDCMVTTIHSLLYIPNMKIDWTFIALKEKLSKEPNDPVLIDEVNNYEHKKEKLSFSIKDAGVDSKTVIIIDEASMVGSKIYQDLKATGAKLLFIGDEAQLPPVKSLAIFHKAKKGATLTDIHRQALDSDVLRLATKVRMNEVISIEDFINGDAQIKFTGEMSKEDWTTADQILTDTNYSRHKINRFIRKQSGYGECLVHRGEKLICTKNNWKSRPPRINGVQCTAIRDYNQFSDEAGSLGVYYAGQDCAFYSSSYNFNANYRKMPFLPWTEFDGMAMFDYGYCLTVHKSQGSEWDNVIYADTNKAFGSMNVNAQTRQLLYTAITRAAKQFTWVLK